MLGLAYTYRKGHSEIGIWIPNSQTQELTPSFLEAFTDLMGDSVQFESSDDGLVILYTDGGEQIDEDDCSFEDRWDLVLGLATTFRDVFYDSKCEDGEEEGY